MEAREAKKPQFLTKIIKCLSALPVDFEALKKGSIGKTTGVLRRHDCASVKTAANELVSKWKSVVDKKRYVQFRCLSSWFDFSRSPFSKTRRVYRVM